MSCPPSPYTLQTMRPSERYDKDDEDDGYVPTAQNPYGEQIEEDEMKGHTQTSHVRKLRAPLVQNARGSRNPPGKPKRTPTKSNIPPIQGVNKKYMNNLKAIFRGSGFCQAEVDHLLGLLDHLLPLCKDEWDIVFTEHKKLFHQHSRTTDSLRWKFATMHLKKCLQEIQ